MPQQRVVYVKRSTFCLLVMFWIDLHNIEICCQGIDTACDESLATAKPKQCPRNKTERDAAAARKNCSSYNNSCKSFEYHCVINEWMNGTTEVCAPSMIIQKGKCAEFSTGFKSIRINFLTDCTKYEPPCPGSYNSTDAYKYGVCYDMVLSTSSPTSTVQVTTMTGTTFKENSSTMTTNGMNNIPKEKDTNIVKIVIPLVMIVILIAVAVIVSVMIIKKRRGRQSSGKNSEKAAREEVPLTTE